jgi:hypothetical protein
MSSSSKFNNITEAEYLKFIDQVQDEAYDMDDDDYMPSDWVELSDYTDPKPEFKYDCTVDATNFKKSKLLDAICKYTNIKVGKFTLRIDSYRSHPLNKSLNMDIVLYETCYKSPSGNPIKIDYRVNLSQDNRFINKPWLSEFTTEGKAFNLPEETVVDIVKWLQMLTKLIAFL